MEFLVEPGTLFGIGRRLCVLLNQAMVPENILEPAINCFVFVVLALLNTENSIDNTVERRIRTKTEKKEANVSHGAADHNDSDGSYADEGDSDNEDLVKSEDEDNHDGENIEDEGSVQDEDSSEAPDNQVASDARVSGLRWLMQRLRGVGIDTRGSRRMNVLKVFLSEKSKSLLFLVKICICSFFSGVLSSSATEPASRILLHIYECVHRDCYASEVVSR
jgi:hypothetical protein